MKLFQIFNKTPNYKKFNYSPRFYNAEEEERKERIARIEREVNDSLKSEEEKPVNPTLGYRERMHGSFRQARESAGMGSGPSTGSATVMRFAILLILSVGFILYLQYGKPVLYGMGALVIGIFLFSKYRNLSKKGPDQRS